MITGACKLKLLMFVIIVGVFNKFLKMHCTILQHVCHSSDSQSHSSGKCIRGQMTAWIWLNGLLTGDISHKL